MMAAPPQDDERLLDLLAAGAVEGLTESELDELQELVAGNPGIDPEELERVAASIVIAGLRLEPMPASLRARVEADASAYFSHEPAD